MLTGKIHDLGHLGLSHFECVDPAFTDAMIMHVQHDAGRCFAILLEESLEDVNDELHRSIIVV